MKRRPFSIAAMLSLLLAIALAGLWVFSHFRDCEVGYYGIDQGWHRDLYLNSSRGSLSFVWLRPGIVARRAVGKFRFQVFRAARDPNGWSVLWAHRDNVIAVLGFIYEHEGSMKTPTPKPAGGRVAMEWRVYAVPYWFLILLASILPIQWYRRNRFGPGRCAACGYDLRATPQEGGELLERCPECGKREMPDTNDTNRESTRTKK